MPRSMTLVVLLAPLLSAGGCNHQPSVRRDPKLSNTHYLMGEDYLKKKVPDGAKRELLRAIELDPENQDAQHLLGVIFFMEGIQKANLLDRKQCLKGLAAEEQRQESNKEFRRSEGYLRTALQLAEGKKKIESDTLNYLANVALHFKRYDEAIALCKKALDNIVYGSRQLALATMGWAYLQKGEKENAARELRQAIFHEPKFCVGRYRLAKVYYEQKDLEKAIEELKRVVEDKDCPIQEAHQLLGLAYLKKGEKALAQGEFAECVKLNPKSCVSEECQRYGKLM